MWIKALRLKEVGKFATGHSVEGFTPGLNVLVGANEHGKSTLLRALRILFEFPHTSNHASVRGLRPYSGGAPLVECGFSLAGGDWQLRKQYLSARSAELRLVDGSALHRGGDVDSVLTGLVESAAGSLATLKSQWVSQGDGFRPPRAAAETVLTIQQVLAEEVSVTTGGDQLDAIVGDVADQLALLVTAKSRRPKSGGPLHEAQQNLQAVTQHFNELREKEELSAKRRARFEEIAGIIDDAATTSETKRLRDDVAARRQSIDAAQARLAQCELATERRKRQAAELDMAVAARKSFLDLIESSDERSARLKEIHQLLEDLNLAKEEGQRCASLLSVQYTELQEKQEANRRKELQREQKRRHAELRGRAGEVRQRLQAAQELQERLDRTDKRLKLQSIDTTSRERAISLQQEIERLSVELKAQSATLVAEYKPDSRAGFFIDAEKLPDGVAISIDGSVVVEAPGIGTLRISPGRSREVAEVRQRYEDKQTSLAGLLAEHGFETVELLDQIWQENQQLGAERQHLLEQLSHLAPEGQDRLVALLSQLQQQIVELNPDASDECELEDEQLSKDLIVQIEQLSDKLKSVQYEAARRDEHERQLKREQQQLQEQDLKAAELKISDLDARSQKVADLKEAVRQADQNLNLVVRQEQALMEGAPSREDVAESIRSVKQQERLLQEREERLATLREEANVLDGALKRDDEDGLGVQLEEISEQLAVAQARVDELQKEVAALELLERELAGIAGDRRRLITEPVVRRVAKIGSPLLGDATFGLSDDLELNSIGRHGLDEPIAAISDGTREQLSVLARLAFAELLADGGYPLPLILDDPLVYSDDRRLADLFSVLQAQSDKHQIIVLTCHESSFSPLASRFGANQVRVDEWREQI